MHGGLFPFGVCGDDLHDFAIFSLSLKATWFPVRSDFLQKAGLFVDFHALEQVLAIVALFVRGGIKTVRVDEANDTAVAEGTSALVTDYVAFLKSLFLKKLFSWRVKLELGALGFEGFQTVAAFFQWSQFVRMDFNAFQGRVPWVILQDHKYFPATFLAP